MHGIPTGYAFPGCCYNSCHCKRSMNLYPLTYLTEGVFLLSVSIPSSIPYRFLHDNKHHRIRRSLRSYFHDRSFYTAKMVSLCQYSSSLVKTHIIVSIVLNLNWYRYWINYMDAPFIIWYLVVCSWQTISHLPTSVDYIPHTLIKI